MSFHQKSPAAEPVRRYLLQQIARSGATPQRLPAERQLVEKLKLSRVTIRRGIEELEESQFIIRLPGRKGAFTNPQKSSLVEFAIGIVVYQNYIGQELTQYLSGISQKLYSSRIKFSLSIFHLSEKSPEELCFELLNSGYDCLIWHTQTPEDIKTINLLLAANFPVITICNLNFPEWGRPARNWYGFDARDKGRQVAAYFLQKGCRKPIFCSDDQVNYQGFVAQLEQRGLATCPPPLGTPQEIELQLPRLLKKNAVDAIYCAVTNIPAVCSLLPPDLPLRLYTPLLFPANVPKLRPPALIWATDDLDEMQKKMLALGNRVAVGVLYLLRGITKERHIIMKQPAIIEL